MGFFDAFKFFRFSGKYEMGFPDIPGENPIVIQFRENEVELKIFVKLSSFKKIYGPDDLIEIGLDQEIYRSAGKAAAGAIVGGMLTGGVGLLVGAALGGKRKAENNLTFKVNDNGVEREIILKPSKEIPKLYKELKRLMIKQSIKPQSESPSLGNTSKSTLADDLEKLHNLLEKGILTQEEFDTKKKKMLE